MNICHNKHKHFLIFYAQKDLQFTFIIKQTAPLSEWFLKGNYFYKHFADPVEKNIFRTVNWIG